MVLLASILGRKIIDQRTGLPIGKAIVFLWGGKVKVIGLRAPKRPVFPLFEPQKRVIYWKQEIVFESHPKPDFTDERRDS